MSAEMTTMLAGIIEQAKEIVELKATNAALTAELERAKGELEQVRELAYDHSSSIHERYNLTTVMRKIQEVLNNE